MSSKKNVHLITILFLLSIFFVLFFELTSADKKEWSLIEGRRLTEYPSLSFQNFKIGIKRIIENQPEEARIVFFNQFLDSTFQQTFSDAASDQFPLRLYAINFVKFLDRKMIELSYVFPENTTIPTDIKTGLYIIKDKMLLIQPPMKFTELTIESIDNRILNYDELITTNPNINFNVFYHERLPNSQYHPLNNYFSNADEGQAFEYFQENKPDELNLTALLFSSASDHEKYYFKTDHHWNIHGALRAYDLVYELLAVNYPDISPRREYDTFVSFPGINFLGSLARKTFYPIQGEKFEVLNYDFPPYTMIEDGQVSSDAIGYEYFEGDYDVEPYINHYGNYYGDNLAIKEYIFENDSNRNILIFGSSFSNSVEPLIASHYHHTYCIDLRKYEDFSLEIFLQTHEIDDFLIIGSNTEALMDGIWLVNP